MSPDSTMREAPPTLLEEAEFEAPTVLEQPPPVVDSVHLVPGARFETYRLVRPLSVASGEADLWLVNHVETHTPYILKYYRYGLFPKSEIMDRLRQVRRQHIVDIIEVGRRADRVFEIQEYVANGSLSDWLQEGIPDECVARGILAEITTAVAHLHSHAVLHRDIKPSNILVRSREPIELVLTDFGISSIFTAALHITSVHRTPAYCAPEALTGIVTKSSDWWSVGVIILEILLKHHPLRGCAEQMINFQLVTKGLSIPDGLGSDWKLLLKGLLTRDYTRRWSSEQISAWLRGERDLPVYYEHPSPLFSRHPRPYKFLAEEYSEPSKLAEAMALNWPEGIKQVTFGYVTRWIETEVQDQSIGAILREIASDRGLDQDQKLGAVLLALSRELPLTFRGDIIDSFWCAQHLSLAIQLTNSSLPAWLLKLRQDSTLLNWRKEYNLLWARLTAHQLALDAQIIEHLFAADQEKVIEAALALRKEFAGSSHAALAALLDAPSIDFAEALLLLACDRSLFFSSQQQEHRQKLDHVHSFACYIDESFAEKLLRVERFNQLEGLWNQAQRHYRLRRETYLKFENARLTDVLQQERPPMMDAVAVLANRLAFRNSLNQIFIPIQRLRVLFGLHPVSQSDYLEFARSTGAYWKPPKFETSENHPILQISWHEASLFCEWLTDLERKQHRIGPVDAYRLPTDIEWSAAVGLQNEPGPTPLRRAGKIKSIYPWGADWPPPAGAGNFGPALGLDHYKFAAPRGSFPPNHLGIYDLGVNVMEWCWDWDDQDERTKVVRGAAWCHSNPDDFLSSARHFLNPSTRSDTISFRTVLVLRSFVPRDHAAGPINT